MGKGYRLEHTVETEIMKVADQTLDMPFHTRTYRVPTSGAMRGEKGDVRTKIPWDVPVQFMIECKDRRQETKKQGRIVRIEKLWLTKCWAEAESEKMMPMFIFAFKGAMRRRIWCVLRTSDYDASGLWSAFKGSEMPGRPVTETEKSLIVSLDEINTYGNSTTANVRRFRHEDLIFMQFDIFLATLAVRLGKDETV